MSKVTPEAFELQGGCDCKAIRYKISVPALEGRPILIPSAQNNGEGDVRAPKPYFDHCNKCRTVSGAIVQCWVTCPQSWINWTLHYNDTENGETTFEMPTSGFFDGSAKDAVVSVFGHYKSSPDVSRYFCNRCGTNLIFVHKGKEKGVLMMDIVLGTLDKGDLEREGMRPDRHIYWEYGVSWMKKIVGEVDATFDGKKLLRHPEGDRNVTV